MVGLPYGSPPFVVSHASRIAARFVSMALLTQRECVIERGRAASGARDHVINRVMARMWAGQAMYRAGAGRVEGRSAPTTAMTLAPMGVSLKRGRSHLRPGAVVSSAARRSFTGGAPCAVAGGASAAQTPLSGGRGSHLPPRADPLEYICEESPRQDCQLTKSGKLPCAARLIWR